MLGDWKTRNNGKPDGVCFGGDRPIPEQSINNHFKSTIKTSGLPKIRVHDLRHSCASMLIAQGVDIVTVFMRLGHSSVKQTLDTYSHMLPSAEDKAVRIFGDFLKNKK